MAVLSWEYSSSSLAGAAARDHLDRLEFRFHPGRQSSSPPRIRNYSTQPWHLPDPPSGYRRARNDTVGLVDVGGLMDCKAFFHQHPAEEAAKLQLIVQHQNVFYKTHNSRKHQHLKAAPRDVGRPTRKHWNTSDIRGLSVDAKGGRGRGGNGSRGIRERLDVFDDQETASTHANHLPDILNPL